MATTTDAAPRVVRSLIPARIDRLPWSRFHTRLVILYVRRNLPESPRWLIMHGKADQAERAQIMPHRLFRNRMDAAAASAPGKASVESHSAASPNTVLHQITKGDTSGGMAADADSAEGPMPPELEAKLIAPDEMRLPGLSGLADRATAVRVIGGNPGRSERPERSWCDWMPDNRAVSAVSGRSRADGALAHRGTPEGSDGNLRYLRDTAPGEYERLMTRAAGAVSDGEP